jgi:hypothetical protein
VPIGKGGFQPLEASAKSGNVLGRLGQLAMGMNRAKQNIEIFNYQQDRKDEGMLKRYAAETASKVIDRKTEFDLANKHILTHGSDMTVDERTGKPKRVTRRNVTAGRYSTGEPDNTPSYGDQLIKNTELKREMAAAKLETARLKAESSKQTKPKKTAAKKTTAKKTAASKPNVKKSAAKAPSGKAPATPKSPGTPTNPALTKMKNSGKVVF